MKKVVSVSLGSSRRNHQVEIRLGGEDYSISRIGTDGDFQKAITLIRELDGKVDAIGLGGIDLYLRVGNRKYILRDGARLANAAEKTPVVDGSGMKYTLEKKIVQNLSSLLSLSPARTPVLLVSGVDRYGMAEGFSTAGYPLIMGDFLFALGFPIPIYSLKALRVLAFFLLPVLTRLPFSVLYPIGERQHESTPRFSRYFEKACLIAGDFHYIKRYAPADLSGKIILTNTTTAEDVEDLRKRGVQTLITTTPVFEGRSFGTNVLEALLVAHAGYRGRGGLSDAQYAEYVEKFSFQPVIRKLQ